MPLLSFQTTDIPYESTATCWVIFIAGGPRGAPSEFLSAASPSLSFGCSLSPSSHWLLVPPHLSTLGCSDRPVSH